MEQQYSADTSSLLLSAQALKKSYAKHLVVGGVDIHLKKGEVLGLLGPNGAGKSTTLQMITGNIAPDSGEVLINGSSLVDDPINAKRSIGYLPEIPPVYRDMTVVEYLNYCAKLHDVEKNELKEAVLIAMQRCGLRDVKHRLITNLSKGFQQRVGIAQAILHQPDVIILDEPTVGLDPVQISHIRDLIHELRKDHSVILSTHILPEVEAVCDRVQMIYEGKTVFTGELNELNKLAQDEGSLVVSFDKPADFKKLNAIPNVSSVSQNRAHSFQLFTKNNKYLEDISYAVFSLAVSEGWKIRLLKPQQQSLEQIFMQYVHKDSAGVAEIAETRGEQPNE